MDTEFYCPKAVLGDGTICSDGYPILSEMVKLGDAPRVQFTEKSLKCRAWQEKCKECHEDCDYYDHDNPEECIGRTGYCKIIDPPEIGYDDY